MTTPSSESQNEIRVLRRLKQQPQLLEIVTDSQLPELRLQKQLRSEYDAQLVRCAMTIVELRRRAASKFTRASEMWFDRKGLEQSTPEAVADYKAQRFQDNASHVTDLCCGVGSDSIAFAKLGNQVTSVDLSPVACQFTNWNSEAYGVSAQIETMVEDVHKIALADRFIHFDPDRRANHKRAVRLEDYSPSLEFLQQVSKLSPGGAIKLSPASNFGGKFPRCEIELISLHGECKEATVWFGTLASASPFRATILPNGFTLAADPADHYLEIGDLGGFLYDPDPAIVRAGLVDALASELGLWRLDDAEEYLTSDTLVVSPAVTPFRVLERRPNHLKEIGKYFRQHPCGELEIKCRHVPLNVDHFRKKIPIHGSGRTTLLIARLSGKTTAIIAERVTTPTP